MLIGFVGIYFFFLLYGIANERVVKQGGFKQTWMLGCIEAFANVIFGAIAMNFAGSFGPIFSFEAQYKYLAPSGFAQVLAKYLTNASMAAGVSFPVATCAKSAKMVPALIGSIFALGFAEGIKKVAKPRPWIQTALVVGGTCVLSLAESAAKKGKGGGDSTQGLVFLVCALACDGAVSFCQEKQRHGMKVKNNFAMQFLTNLYMCATAAVFMVAFGEVQPGIDFLKNNPDVLMNLLGFAITSACGQGVIFYVVANLGPAFNSCVTTSRKVFSVLLSVFMSGKALSGQGWGGISMVAIGVFGEVEEKLSGAKAEIKKKAEATKKSD
jgi:UDP-galactose transporter B1